MLWKILFLIPTTAAFLDRPGLPNFPSNSKFLCKGIFSKRLIHSGPAAAEDVNAVSLMQSLMDPCLAEVLCYLAVP